MKARKKYNKMTFFIIFSENDNKTFFSHNIFYVLIYFRCRIVNFCIYIVDARKAICDLNRNRRKDYKNNYVY